MSLPGLAPLPRSRLADGVVARVQQLIDRAHLGPGARLPSERDLAGHLGVSRVVVREALRSLEQAGLVQVRVGAKGGAFIARDLHKPVADAARHLFRRGDLTLQHFVQARQAVEGFGIRLAAGRARRRDLDRLRALNRRLRDDVADPAKLREHNAAFHAAVADLSGNPLLTLLVQSLLDLLGTVLPEPRQAPAFARDTVERHEAIVEAMARRDVARAADLMAADIAATERLRRAARPAP
jgi:DNA-binding FadR family transcriptional regulator